MPVTLTHDRTWVHIVDMTTAPNERAIPQLTLGWRLRMALETAGISREQIAAEFGVDPKTISRWTHEVGTAPKRAYILQWAILTGVDATWLETGKLPDDPETPGGEELPADEESRNILLGRQRLYQLSYVRDAALADGGDNLATLQPCA